MEVERRCVLQVLLAFSALATTGCGLVDDSSPPPVADGSQASPSRQSNGGGSSGGGTVAVAAVGDTMLGMTPTLPATPARYFDRVRHSLRGDIVFGNLEGALTDVSESPKCGAGSSECFAFRAPPEFGRALRAAGFTVMSNANNHSFDYGQAGQEETLEALDRAGIAHTGMPEEVEVVRAGGRRIAFVGFASYANTAPLTDLGAARELIRRARKQAEIVVVAFHAGAEGSDAQHVTGEEEVYLGEDRGNPEEFAHMAIEAGADLILGSGPHVLRGMEIYRDRLIAYSLGNFSGYENFSLEGALGQSVILHAALAGDGSFQAGRLDSVLLVDAGQPVPDPEDTGAELVSALSSEDFGPTAVRIGPSGRIAPSH
jgi:Bacterial capsule synthesis protein PGA_cap